MKPRIALLSLLLALTSTPAVATRKSLLVSTQWLAHHVDDRNVVVLHVGRDRADYEKGHLPGARFLAFGDLVVTRDGLQNELPPAAALKQVFERAGAGDASRIVLYGDMSGLLAARAFVTLDYLGHGDRAALLDGGMEKWRAESRPLSTEVPPPPPPAQFTVAIRPEVIASLAAVRDISWMSETQPGSIMVLLDARPAEEFSGAKPSDGISRAGHIPGARGLYWMDTLKTRETPELRPISDLRRLFAQAGVQDGDRVVTYCRTGVQASFLYFVARYLGYDAALYDGSFAEWSKVADTAVAKSSK